MDEKSRKELEYELADVITAQPHEFTVGRKHYRLYPVTLAKMYLLKEYMAALGIDMEGISVNPYLETLRVVKGKRRICCSILAIHTTPNTYKDLYCRQSIAERRNAFEKVRVEDLAEELFISRPYLSAKFRKETGQSLTDFILGEKTEEAKRLLRYSDKTSAAIAAYLGFSSQGHFCRVFRTYAGMTPNEYRNKSRIGG